MSKPRPTFADYVVIGLSPVLIMGLVGSLVFFLLEVFYHGQFEARMNFIMAMFVLAAVLIARISIEEGREYSALFAVPLAIVTLLAMFRFVQFQGALAQWSMVINIGLLATIWWCADRLTWDCTVIDESQDASGEGLLQTVGLDQDPATTESAERPQVDLEATTSRETPPTAQPASGGSLWQRFVKKRHRPHPHGVWVVYFSLAAIPIFGVGQWFVPSGDSASRGYVLKLLLVYVACALGLLLTTSFLGLRRYLRQRRLEMPAEMAATWIGIGATMIVAILAACLLLPRRNPVYSLAELPFFASSPTGLRTSKYGFGHDGPQRDDADRAANRKTESEQQQGSGKNAQESSSQQGSSGENKSSQGKSPAGKSGEDKSGEGKASAGKSGDSKSGQGKSDSQGQQGKTSQSSSGNQSPPDKDSQSQGSQHQSGEKPSSGEKSSSGQSKSDRSQGDSKRDSSGKAPGDRTGENGKTGGEKRDKSTRQDERQGSGKERRETETDREAQARREQEAARDRSTQPARQPPSSSSWSPSRLLSSLTGAIGSLLRLFYWAVVILIVGYLLWRYRAQVMRALQEFFQSLRELWERLFGGHRAGPEVAAAAEAPAARPPRPFADFADPFLSGQAQRWSVEELVRYTFQAFEAWARERGCPRAPEQTPSEFARNVASQETSVRQTALQLAELYNVSAYGQQAVPPTSAAPLRRLWESLRTGAAS